MLRDIMKNTNEYVNSFPKADRKAYGQFFTPVSTAEYMAGLVKCSQKHVSLLDPGAGNGLLTAAVVKRLIAQGQVESIKAVLYENDDNIQELLQNNIKIISEYCEKAGVELDICLRRDNFILSNQEYWRKKKTKGHYDIVICNPPYRKIGKKAPESVCMNEIVHGQPNLYFLFMAMSVKLLKQQGEFVFITPRSWTSGLYFKYFRNLFFEQTDLQYVHLFHSRSRVFQESEIENDKILQETIITYGAKSIVKSESITVASCMDVDSFPDTERMIVPRECCLLEGKANYLLLPTEQEDLEILRIMRNMPNSVSGAGYRFKTGPVVEFRNREFVSKISTGNTVPLLHSCNVLEGRISFPVDTDKPQYFYRSEKSEKNILKNQNTVFIKRATAKEEPRRLQPALHLAEDFQYQKLSAENHLNYLIKIGEEMSVCEVYGFYTLLSSDLWEHYYRMLNGSTQVNSEELNSMPLPKVETLQHIGRMAMHFWQDLKDLTVSSDEIIRRALG